MGFKLSNFDTDEDLENEGVWQEYEEGFELKIARFSNRKHMDHLRSLQKDKLRSMSSDEMVSEEKNREILRQSMSQFVLMDWRNMVEDDGKTEIPYTVDLGYKFLHDQPVLQDVIEVSQKRDRYRKAVKLQSVKNSKTS